MRIASREVPAEFAKLHWITFLKVPNFTQQSVRRQKIVDQGGPDLRDGFLFNLVAQLLNLKFVERQQSAVRYPHARQKPRSTCITTRRSTLNGGNTITRLARIESTFLLKFGYKW